LRLGRSLALPAEFTFHGDGIRSSDTEFVRLSTIELNKELKEKKEGRTGE
jgi:hypothetical protein